MGTDKIGIYLEQGLSPQQIEGNYAPALESFKAEREKYLIRDYGPGAQEIMVTVKGKAVLFDSAPYIDSHNRVMVPLRAIVEALGAKVEWSQQTKTITVTAQDNKVIFTVDSYSAEINGERREMDTTPVIKNNRTMVPARYIGEYLGAVVRWDASLRTVTID